MELIDPWLLAVMLSDPLKKMNAKQIVRHANNKEIIDPWLWVVTSTDPLKKIKVKQIVSYAKTMEINLSLDVDCVVN